VNGPVVDPLVDPVVDPGRRYPTALIDVVRLVDGRRVTLRPPLPQDCDLQRRFVRGLSDEARYFRFLTRLQELPEAMAERFTAIDYHRHVALVATVFQGAGEAMVGEARYILDDRDPAVCEFAVAVTDRWQRRGLARLLLVRLIGHAATSGVRRMAGITTAGNAAMIALARRLGFAVALKPEDSRLVQLVRDLPRRDRHPDASTLAAA
jgi:acetyltransferase